MRNSANIEFSKTGRNFAPSCPTKLYAFKFFIINFGKMSFDELRMRYKILHFNDQNIM